MLECVKVANTLMAHLCICEDVKSLLMSIFERHKDILTAEEKTQIFDYVVNLDEEIQNLQNLTEE